MKRSGKRRVSPPRRRGQRTARRSRKGRPRDVEVLTPQSTLRWNPDPEDVQRSVVKLVLSLIEFIRKLMERQAIRRLEAETLTPEEVENVGLALMKLEETVKDLARRFKIDVNELNLDLGPIGKLH